MAIKAIDRSATVSVFCEAVGSSKFNRCFHAVCLLRCLVMLAGRSYVRPAVSHAWLVLLACLQRKVDARLVSQMQQRFEPVMARVLPKGEVVRNTVGFFAELDANFMAVDGVE